MDKKGKSFGVEKKCWWKRI